MSGVFGLLWGLMGIIFSFAGKSFLEVSACFLVCGAFLGVAELGQFRQEIGVDVKEIKKILEGGNDID